MRRLLLPLAMVLNACVPATLSDTASRTAMTGGSLPQMKSFAARAPKPQPVSNRALAKEFIDLSFQLESGRPLPVLTRFEGPITLRVTGRAPSTLLPDLRGLLSRLEAEAGIEIELTKSQDANVTVEAVPSRAIRKILPNAACFVAPNVSSIAEFRRERRSSRTNWATLTTRETLVIVIPNDVSPQEIRDCLHEELAQALGPLNDLYSLPNSVFNDDNVHAVLTNYDMLVLRATYAPELASGMSRNDVEKRLPKILARINPRGQSRGRSAATATPQSYVVAIQTALGPGSDNRTRQSAAEEAVWIAQSAGWKDNRRGFAHYALGRVLQSTEPQAAYNAFLEADRFYARSQSTRLHRAYVATQLAGFALASGDPTRARMLVTPHIPQAREAQNAALLATLQLIRAESLRQEGQIAEADAERLDSLGWARYGFGADWAVQSKVREISSLSPAAPPV